MLTKNPEERHQALDDLIRQAPMNKLPDVMANVNPFFDHIDKSKSIAKTALRHSYEHMVILAFERNFVLLAEENCARNTQNGVCTFYTQRFDMAASKEICLSFSVDIFELKVLKVEECEASVAPCVFFEAMFLSRFEFIGHLARRYPSKDVLKHFLFIKDEEIFIIYYTMKLVKPDSSV